MSTKSTRDIKTVLTQVLANHNLESQIQEIYIYQKWSDIVGSSLAKQCTPIAIEDDTLHIEVKNSIWLRELVARQGELLALIIEKSGNRRIKKIKFI